METIAQTCLVMALYIWFTARADEILDVLGLITQAVEQWWSGYKGDE